jgi:hypothetical protein
MIQQPEALRLAAALDALLGYRGINADVGKAAAELRRLHAENAELLEALKLAQSIIGHPDDAHSQHIAAVIAKATGEKT